MLATQKPGNVAGQTTRRVLVLLAASLMLLALAGPAAADGDPASDYLLGRTAFVPPDSGISSASAARLTAVLADAKARGYTIRVALVASRYDMGSVTALWKHPRIYARFLGQELRLLYHGRLLVVMPNGYATSRGGKPTADEQAVVDPLPLPRSSAVMADAAVRAVIALAAHAGVVVVPPKAVAAPSHNASRDRLKIALAALAVVLLGTTAWWARRLLVRRRRA